MSRIAQAMLLAVLVCASAWAQRTSRPSDRGPSTQVGVTGGAYTRDLGISVQPPATSSASQRLRQEARGRGIPRIHVPAALLLGQPGFHRDRGAAHPLFRIPTMDRSTLRQISGLNRSLNVGVLRPWKPSIALPRMPYYAAEEAESAFADYFDLAPAPEETPQRAADGPPPDLSMADLLRRENELIESQRLERALAAFKKGTTLRGEDRLEQLAIAQSLLEDLAGPRAEDSLPALLLVHTALEREQILVASRTLLELVERDPQVFIRKPDIAKYYGDAQLLDLQMRQRQRLGDENPTDAAAYALQAYCNLVRGEVSRTREALIKMDAVNRQHARDPRIRLVGLAISAAMQ